MRLLNLFQLKMPLGLAFMLLLFLFTSCEKGFLENAPVKPEPIAALQLTPISNCENDNICTDLLCILTDEENAKNHKVNMILYHYAQAVRTAAVDTDLLCMMVDAIQEDADGYGVSLSTLAAENELFSSNINTTLKTSITEKNVYPKGEEGLDELLATPNWNANNYLQERLTYGEDTYEPVIYFIKAPNSCQTEEAVTVLIAEAANCEDEVAGWQGNQMVLLSEEEVINGTGIYIFVGPGIPQNFDPEHKPAVIGKAEQTNLILANVDIDADRHQIKKGYRYEKSGKSDVKGWEMEFFPSTEKAHILGRWDDFNPRRIKKRDIDDSKIFTNDLNVFDMSLEDFNNGKQAFIGTWEDDWYASLKVIKNNCSPFISHSVSVKMKYAHEWYFFDCNILKNWFPNVGSHEKFENKKCMFDLKRTK